jgi:hypothetical protein
MLETLQRIVVYKSQQFKENNPSYNRKVTDCSCDGGYQEYVRDGCCRPVTKSAPAVPDKNYAFSHAEYMRQKCQTIEQKSYTFSQQESATEFRSGGCVENCNLATYKPNNAGFSTQGAVSASTRMMRLKYDATQAAREPYRTHTRANEIVEDMYCVPVYKNGRRVLCQ